MSKREQRQFLQRELLQAEHFLKLSSGHPLMEPQFAQRANALRAELATLPEDGLEARTVLFFTGKPVSGSAGIDAQFVSSVLQPFLEMVKSQYAADKHGSVGERGPRKDEDEARLMLTGTPRGSFGLELSAPHSDDLFAEERLASVLVQLTRVIEAAGESDEGFLLNLDNIEERAFHRLPDFFKVLKDEEADLRMQTGDIELTMTQERVARAFERVSSSHTTDKEVEVHGVFRGATLDTWRFDFRTEEGEQISGRLSPDLDEDRVAEMFSLANKGTTAKLRQITTVLPGGAMRRRFVLLDLA